MEYSYKVAHELIHWKEKARLLDFLWIKCLCCMQILKNSTWKNTWFKASTFWAGLSLSLSSLLWVFPSLMMDGCLERLSKWVLIIHALFCTALLSSFCVQFRFWLSVFGAGFTSLQKYEAVYVVSRQISLTNLVC